ncbi:cyclin-T-like isoform X2 [Belonocnema kinseyi]|uniref:cyclin-T-like isoform X2 n=1 Tax=Belonocnema kinseyi TaxID=2817044 RepID=UPI00143DB146|nr:cyclin-T-like isoform X2 [Belonocnema kinseyi]
MAADAKWYFTKEQLAMSPSRRCGIDADKELSYRQQAANLIQDMGQRLSVTQLCINTAIVYMHRFYVFHSLTQFPRNKIAAAALFLAAKTEEQPRKLEHVIRCAHVCLHREGSTLDMKSDQYLEQANELVSNESALLMTLGFELAIDHPHTHVVRCCHLVKANKDLAQTSYFMASNSLHLTTMCLQYRPTVVACFCIHLTCKWSNWEIPQSNEGKHWFWYIDKTVTMEILQKLTAEFLHVFDKCPSRLKKKIKSMNDHQSPNMGHPISNSPFETEPRKIQSPAPDGGPTFQSNRPHHPVKHEHPIKHEHQVKHEEKKPSMPARSSMDVRDYREKKERERLDREKQNTAGSSSGPSSLPDLNKHHSHHHKPVPGPIPHKQPPNSNQKSALHHNHHHRPDMKMSQSIPQRHSSSQPREPNRDPSRDPNRDPNRDPSRDPSRDPNRDPNRQRAPRDFNSSGTSGSSMYPHHNISQKETIDASQPDPSARLDSGLPQESAVHPNVQDRMSNNNHNVHRISSHDKRYDPRHNKVPEHRKEDQKAYPEYRDMSRVDRQRKPDSLEQRSEEVRKLIEKPLPPPKPKAEVQREDYIAHILKQSHHSKHNQSDKLQGNSGQSLSIPASPQVQQKSLPKPMSHQHSSHGMQQFVKESVKNGSSHSAVPVSNEEVKVEKRPRHEEDRSLVQQQNAMPVKPKSLFSPEKTQRETPRESHQRSKSRQKTPPSAKAPKQSPLDMSATLISPFSSPSGLQQQDMVKRHPADAANSSHKRHRGLNELDQSASSKDVLSSIFKSTNSIPELLQPIADNPNRSASFLHDTKISELMKPFEPEPTLAYRASHGPLTNGVESRIPRQDFPEAQEFPKTQDFSKSSQDFFKNAQEFSKIQDFPKHMLQFPRVELHRIPDIPKSSSSSVASKSTPVFPKNPPDYVTQELQEFLVTQDPIVFSKQELNDLTEPIPEVKNEIKSEPLEDFSHNKIKAEPLEDISRIKVKSEPLEEFSRTKSAQSISALLQEPLATMPSLLQQFTQPPKPTQEFPPTLTPILPPEIATPEPFVSTVDMGALSGSTIDSTLSAVSIPILPIAVEEKKSEHHKSEKKKKEKKHKHKDKDKSKEKHKHKHKDKDKERHRDKERKKAEQGENVPTEPIKITIPKDKINLSSESLGSGEKLKSPPGKIKIKIAKERLKVAEAISASPIPPVQGPLKIKIRTDAISRTSTSTGDTTTHESRKRERSDENPTTSGPPTKKQQSVSNPGFVPQRSNERQNGRHYNSGSNNKEKHSSSHHKSSHKLSQQST